VRDPQTVNAKVTIRDRVEKVFFEAPNMFPDIASGSRVAQTLQTVEGITIKFSCAHHASESHEILGWPHRADFEKNIVNSFHDRGFSRRLLKQEVIKVKSDDYTLWIRAHSFDCVVHIL
jgi:hypothetical protein